MEMEVAVGDGHFEGAALVGGHGETDGWCLTGVVIALTRTTNNIVVQSAGTFKNHQDGGHGMYVQMNGFAGLAGQEEDFKFRNGWSVT